MIKSSSLRDFKVKSPRLIGLEFIDIWSEIVRFRHLTFIFICINGGLYFTAIIYLASISQGGNSPTVFLICFSLLLILGDQIFPRDKKIQHFSYPSLLNLSIYINLPILLILVLIVI